MPDTFRTDLVQYYLNSQTLLSNQNIRNMKEKYEYQIGYLNKILKIFSQILYYNLKDLKCFTVKPI